MKYHKYGGLSHAEIANMCKFSTSLAHKLETDAMLKFGLMLFNPPWPIKNMRLRRLKDRNGHPIRFEETGLYFEELADVVYRNIGQSTGDEIFRTEYEKQIIVATGSIEFRKYVMSLYTEHCDG